jgi:cob(I)alamin adenosyltransferase
VQAALVDIRRVIAAIGEQISQEQKSVLSPREIEDLERIIVEIRGIYNENCATKRQCYLPTSAFANVARAQCRRAERRLLTLSEASFSAAGLSDYVVDRKQFECALLYLNRLAELLSCISDKERPQNEIG